MGGVLIIAGVAGSGGASWCCSVIPSGSPTRAGSHASGRMMGCAKRGCSTAGRGQSEGSTTPPRDSSEYRGGLDLHGLAAGRRSLGSHAAAPCLAVVPCAGLAAWAARRVQGADVVVAQRVVDELDLFAGRGHGADVLPTPVGDLGLVGADHGVGPIRLTDSTAAHRTSREPCLVIRPRCTWVSDSWCLGSARPTRPAGWPWRTGSRRRPRPRTPRPGSARPPAAAAPRCSRGRRPACPRASRANRSISSSRSSISRCSDCTRASYGAGSREMVEERGALQAEQIRHRHPDPALGQHRMDLGLAAAAQPDQLGPVPHQLPQLPRGRRRDPRLRQPPHPQQVGQVRGIAEVVLDPPVLKRLHPQRMRQMHPSTRRLQGVDRPVPAIGGLQHHLGILTQPAPSPGSASPRR